VPGEGARLELRIPIALAAGESGAAYLAAARSGPVQVEAGQPVYRLLVADDQADNRSLLEFMLQKLGFAVRTAADGAETLRVWEEWQPHLVWMDMSMPVVDGYEATRRIKATPQGRSTVVVALTASVREGDRERGVAAGCDDLLHKPFRQADLERVLARHLGVRFASARAAGALPPAVRPPRPRGLDLSGLPPDWIAQVRQAAIAADGTRLAALAAAIDGERPAPAAALRAFVEEFNYQAILEATEEPLHG
jgi:CheY-like chemotaxis protein